MLSLSLVEATSLVDKLITNLYNECMYNWEACILTFIKSFFFFLVSFWTILSKIIIRQIHVYQLILWFLSQNCLSHQHSSSTVASMYSHNIYLQWSSKMTPSTFLTPKPNFLNKNKNIKITNKDKKWWDYASFSQGTKIKSISQCLKQMSHVFRNQTVASLSFVLL